jgi:RNA 3'-terminal phosphate cyclase (ATP)
MISIDGSRGEGGGQILRTSLALSAATGAPISVRNVRAGRKKPGLLRQHLTALNAAAEITGAEVTGAEPGSGEFTFAPGLVRPGEYRFAVGTAGSACLVLQTVLPPLLFADGPSSLTLEGGTHNPWAPPYDFLAKAFLPQLEKMGARVETSLDRYGFYPAGGGRFTVEIEPVEALEPLSLTERGAPLGHGATATVAHLSPEVARRELKVVRQKLGWSDEDLEVNEVRNSPGPGNVLLLEVRHENVTEVVTGFGRKMTSAEKVAHQAADELRRWLRSDVPVGRYLADQLLLPLALAGKGEFRTLPLTRHSETNIEVIGEFLDVPIKVSEEPEGARLVTVG